MEGGHRQGDQLGGNCDDSGENFGDIRPWGAGLKDSIREMVTQAVEWAESQLDSASLCSSVKWGGTEGAKSPRVSTCSSHMDSMTAHQYYRWEVDPVNQGTTWPQGMKGKKQKAGEACWARVSNGLAGDQQGTWWGKACKEHRRVWKRPVRFHTLLSTSFINGFNQGGDKQTGKVALALSLLTVNYYLVLGYYALYEPLQHKVYVVCHSEKSCRGWWVLLGPTQTALMGSRTPPAVGAAAADGLRCPTSGGSALAMAPA